MKAVLTIAGSDSSGGAGIQADLKTIIAHRLFGESVITALTAQNTTGVFGVMDVDPAFVGAQMDAVFDDIRPDAVKIGMVSSPDIVRAIADGLRRHHACNIVVEDATATFLVGDQESGLDYMKTCYAAKIVDTDEAVRLIEG